MAFRLGIQTFEKRGSQPTMADTSNVSSTKKQIIMLTIVLTDQDTVS